MIIGIVLIIGVFLYFYSKRKKKYNTDLETINPPMTKKERKVLMFYRKTIGIQRLIHIFIPT